VASGDKKNQRRKWDILVFDKSRVDMGLQMVNRNKRLLKSVSQSLGKRKAHKKRPDQTRSLGHRDEIDVFNLYSGSLQTFFKDKIYGNDMVS